MNAANADGNTALHHAAARGDNEMIQYLVSKGANVKAVDREGRTIVHPDVTGSQAHLNLSKLPQVAKVVMLEKSQRDAPDEVPKVGLGRDGQDALVAHAVSQRLGWLVFVERPLAAGLLALTLVLLLLMALPTLRSSRETVFRE